MALGGARIVTGSSWFDHLLKRCPHVLTFQLVVMFRKQIPPPVGHVNGNMTNPRLPHATDSRPPPARFSGLILIMWARTFS